MIDDEVSEQLQRLTDCSDFSSQAEELVDTWMSNGVGLEVVDPVLRFMERNPSILYGMPGALVHFVERFYGQGYEQALIESIRRRPTPHTVWMLNRVINGTKALEVKNAYILELRRARTSTTDRNTLERINQFLDNIMSE